MVVTYTRTTSPPPAGNIILADDTEIDGSEGIVQHSGGYILAGGSAATAYYLKILEDAELEQQGGDIRAEIGGRFIMDQGGILTFTGSTNTYRLDIYAYGGLIVRGTDAKECYIRGSDDSNRMAYMYITYARPIKCKHLTVQNCTSYLSISTVPQSGIPYFEDCTFTLGAGAVNVFNGYGIMVFKNCILGDANNVITFGAHRMGVIFLFNCTINQSHPLQINNDSYLACFVYNDITFSNVTPTSIQDPTPTYSSLMEIACKKFTVDEQNNLQDCEFNVYHDNLTSIQDINNITDDKNYDWSIIGLVMRLLYQLELTDSNGQAEIIVPWKFKYRDQVAATTTWYELSESGGLYSHNGQYKLVLSKDGYRRQETTYWGSSNQIWNATLQAQSDFDDIIDDLNDIKGTGFVKDTNSLVDQSHQEGEKGTDAIYDVVSAVQNQVGMIGAANARYVPLALDGGFPIDVFAATEDSIANECCIDYILRYALPIPTSYVGGYSLFLDALKIRLEDADADNNISQIEIIGLKASGTTQHYDNSTGWESQQTIEDDIGDVDVSADELIIVVIHITATDAASVKVRYAALKCYWAIPP